MAINERNIRVDIQEGQIAKGLLDTFALLKQGQSNLRVNLHTEGDKDLLKFIEAKISPEIDLSGVKTALGQIESEFTQLRTQLSRPIEVQFKVGGATGIDGVNRGLQGMAQQAQSVAAAGKSISSTYAQVGQQVSTSVQRIQRQLESLKRTQSSVESTAFRTTQNFRGLPVRQFTDKELASGSSTRLDQRLLLRGLDQAAIVPGQITRQTQISPHAAASEYIRQEKELERLAKKKEDLETRLQERLSAERQRELQREQSKLESIARRASSQNLNITDLRSPNSETTRVLAGLANQQGRLQNNPLFEAQQLVANAARTNRIAKQFETSVGFREFFAASEGERRNERLGRISKILEEHPNIPGLEDRLRREALEGRLPSRFDLNRLKDPKVATQVAFGGVFGGGRGLLSAGVGGAIGGVGGALAAATVQQAVDSLIGPIVEAFDHRKAEFQEAGSAFEGSILSISAALQQTTEILGPAGKPLGSSNIQAQLSFQEREATRIQLAARKELLPQGIGGSTEATFVRGIVAALGQRGINANAGEVSQIARVLAGVIQTQRPQLLENTSLLNRDLQDVLSGLPQASRTILGSLIRTSLPKLAKATSGQDVVTALQNQSAFADVAINSRNPVALQNKLKGAEDQLNTVGGESFLKAQSFGLQIQTNVLQMEALQQASANLGTGLGRLDSAMRILDVTGKSLGADLINIAATGFENLATNIQFISDTVLTATSIPSLGRLGISTGQDLIDLRERERDNQRADELIAEAQAVKARSTASGRINSGLEGVGLIDPIEKFQTERLQSSVNRGNSLDRLERLFGDSERFKELAPAIFNERIGILDNRFKERSSIFSGSEGDIQSGRLQREEIVPEQLNNAAKLSAAASERIDTAIKRITEAEASRNQISNDLEKEQAALRSAQNNRRTNPPTTLIEDAQSRLEEAQIKARIEDLKVNRREKEVGISTGDAEIQNLTDQLIESGRKEVELKDRVVQSQQKETDIVLGRLSKITSAFDIQTQSGSVEEARRALIELNAAASIAAKTVDQFKTELQSVAAAKDAAVVARQLTNDPGVRTQRDEQIRDLSRKENELKKRLESAEDVQRNIDLQTFRKNLQASDAVNIPLSRQRNRLDTFTFSGQLKSIDLIQEENSNIVRSRVAELGRQRQILKNDPTNTAAKSAVEILQNDIASARQQRDVIQPRNRTLTSFDRSIGQVDLDQALKKSSRLVDDESIKRKELNVALEASTAKLNNFASELKASNLSQEGELLSIADQLRSINPSLVPSSLGGPEGFDEDTQQRLKAGLLIARGNSIARKFTGSDIFQGDQSGLGLPRGLGNEVEIAAKSESEKLTKSVTDVSRELSDLTLAFKKSRLELQKEVFTLQERLKPLPAEEKQDAIAGKKAEPAIPPKISVTGPLPLPVRIAGTAPAVATPPAPPSPSKIEPPKSFAPISAAGVSSASGTESSGLFDLRSPGSLFSRAVGVGKTAFNAISKLYSPALQAPIAETDPNIQIGGGRSRGELLSNEIDLQKKRQFLQSSTKEKTGFFGELFSLPERNQTDRFGIPTKPTNTLGELLKNASNINEDERAKGGGDRNIGKLFGITRGEIDLELNDLATTGSVGSRLRRLLELGNTRGGAPLPGDDSLQKQALDLLANRTLTKDVRAQAVIDGQVADPTQSFITSGGGVYTSKLGSSELVQNPFTTFGNVSKKRGDLPDRFVLPEFELSPEEQAKAVDNTDQLYKNAGLISPEVADVKSLEFNQLDAPIREVEPLIETRGRNKVFVKRAPKTSSVTQIDTRGAGNKIFSKRVPKLAESSAHKLLRADIGADLVDTFDSRLYNFDVDSTNLAGANIGQLKDVRTADIPLPSRQRADYASAIFGASVGLNSFVSSSLDDTPLPSGRTPKVNLPAVPANAASAQRQASEQNKNLEAKISALTAAITNLTSNGLKLEQSSITSIGDQVSGAFK